MTAQILAGAAIVVVTAAIIFEARAWTHGTRMVTRRQKLYRVLAAGMMDVILALVIVGPVVHARTNPYFEIGYWGATTMLSFLLIFVALLDVRAGLVNYRESRREAFHGAFGEERQEE